MTVLIWLAVLFVLYALTILYLVFARGAFRVVYDPFVGWCLRTFAGNIECITIGARCYTFSASDVLTDQRRLHEQFHYDHQWRRYPLTFLPRYWWELARFGYDKMPMEQDARAAGGEPLR